MEAAETAESEADSAEERARDAANRAAEAAQESERCHEVARAAADAEARWLLRSREG